MLNFLKKRWLLITIIVVVIGGIWWWRAGSSGPTTTYTTEPVKRGDLAQTIEATGTVKPEATLSLNFSAQGTVTEIPVAIGSRVTKGDTLIKLDDRDAYARYQQAVAQLASAQAQLKKGQSGAASTDITISERQADQALINLQNALTNLDNVRNQVGSDTNVTAETIAKAQKDLADAQQNLLDITALEDHTIATLNESSLNTMTVVVADASVALDIGKTILEDENGKNYFGAGDTDARNQQLSSRTIAEKAINEAKVAVTAAKSATSEQTINTALELTIVAAQNTFDNVVAMYDVLVATPSFVGLPVSKLDSYKATITAQQAKMNADITSTQTLEQNITTAQLNRRSRINAANTQVTGAQKALDLTFANQGSAGSSRQTSLTAAENQVRTAQAAYDIAKAQVDQVKAPARSYDISVLRANVDQMAAGVAIAQKNLDDMTLRAPRDGIVTDVNLDEGEQTTLASAVAPAISLISVDGFTVEVNISESDIAKVALGDRVDMTFDAFGDDMPFTGEVKDIHPGQTVIQEVIYYTVIVSVNNPNITDIKPGMTANLTIHTDERTGTLYIPRRAVFEKDGKKYTRVLENNTPREVEVQTGLRADDGLIEILSGVTEGQNVVTFVKEN